MVRSRGSAASWLIILVYGVGEIVAWGLPLAGLLALAEWISSHWPVLALAVYPLVMVLAAFLPGVINFILEHPDQLSARTQRNIGSVALDGLFALLPYLAAFVLAAGQFFKYWNQVFGGFSVTGGQGAYWDWAVYAFSWAFDNVFANVGQIFGLEPSSIHAISQPARIAVFIYNVALEFVLLSALFNAVGKIRRFLGRRNSS
jgi:hypothetical protein